MAGRNRFLHAPVAVLIVGVLIGVTAQPASALLSPSVIRGVVHDEAGVPLPSVCVTLLDPTSKKAVASTRTAIDGKWSRRAPLLGAIVRFRDCGSRGFRTRYYGASQLLSMARVVLGGSRADTVMTKQAGNLWGSVASDEGLPLTVCAQLNDAAPPHPYVGTVVGGSDGRWRATGLMPDRYIVTYSDCGGMNYRSRIHGGDGQTLASAAVVRPGDELTAVLEHTLASWQDGLALAASAPADVLLLGDSITQGYGASTSDQWWVGQVRAGLQDVEGGVGYLPVQGHERAPAPFPEPWTREGGMYSSSGLGRRSHVLGAEGDTASVELTADRVWIHYIAQPDGGLIDVTVDGQPAGRIDTAATSYDASARWDSGALGDGRHVVQLTAAADAGGAYRPAVVQGAMAFRGDDTRGVRIWESGHAGYTAAHFGSDESWPSALRTVDPEVVLVAFGPNDLNYFTPAEFATHLEQLVSTVRANAPEPPAIGLVSMYRPSYVASTLWPKYAAAQQRVASALGLAFVDLDKLATAAGHSADTLTDDGVHPNDEGQRFIAKHVSNLLIEGHA